MEQTCGPGRLQVVQKGVEHTHGRLYQHLARLCHLAPGFLQHWSLGPRHLLSVVLSTNMLLLGW